MRDFGLSKEEAGVVLGNLGHESAGFEAFAEGGGGPGRGWAQWTERGRKARFFAYAQENGLDPRSDAANYGFLKWELSHTHRNAIAALKAGATTQDKMVGFERSFEGAGVKAYGSRFRYMNEALRAYDAHQDRLLAIRKHFGHPHIDGKLLDHARRSGMLDGGAKMTGSAGVTIDFRNMPKGVTTTGRADGMFKSITLNRGYAMALADQSA